MSTLKKQRCESPSRNIKVATPSLNNKMSDSLSYTQTPENFGQQSRQVKRSDLFVVLEGISVDLLLLLNGFFLRLYSRSHFFESVYTRSLLFPFIHNLVISGDKIVVHKRNDPVYREYRGCVEQVLPDRFILKFPLDFVKKFCAGETYDTVFFPGRTVYRRQHAVT